MRTCLLLRWGLYALPPLISLAPTIAQARPIAPPLFCETYPDAPMCIQTGLVACAMCHTQAPVLNDFGADVKIELIAAAGNTGDAAFEDFLTGSLLSLETEDSDGDGLTNLEELELGSYPGNPKSLPTAVECPDEPIGGLDVCNWDPRYTFLRVWQDFCGRRPDYDTVLSFEALTAAAKREQIHETLDTCLAGEFWRGRDGAVWQLAHRKIRPVSAVQILANYDVDYSIFAWANLDHHDVRDVLLADYFVSVTLPGVYPTVYEQVADMSGQVMQQDRRVGTMSTSWFLLYNIMFSAIPRTAAAQAYRSYLNYDIAKLDGLDADATPPVDYDGAGIDAPACATCHSTLEPLTYPFTRYNAFQDPGFMYDPNRMADFAITLNKPSLANVPEQGRLLGVDVADLKEWASVAANSDRFFASVTEDYWKLLVGGEPAPDEADMYADYQATWQSLREDPNHSVFSMLHVLVDTEAYGAP